MTPSRPLPTDDASAASEPLVDRLTADDIYAAIAASACRKGAEYQRQGRVGATTIAPPGDRIESRVKGSALRPYSQSIRLIAESDGTIRISGLCTCPIGIDCKHVAAVLFAVLAGPAPARATISRFAAPAPPPRPVSENLAPELSTWIDALARLEQTETETYPAAMRQRLVYVLDLEPAAGGVARLCVQPVSARLLKDGSFAPQAKPLPVTSFVQAQYALFVRPSDRAILDQLRRMPGQYSYPAIALAGEEGAAALAAMIATGRARWAAASGPVLSQGPVRVARLVWRTGADGAQRPDLEIAAGDGDARAVRLAPPHYVDLGHAAIGPLETGLAPRIAATILAAPAVPHRQGELVRAAIRRRAPALAPLEPPALAPPERIAVRPVPGIRLSCCTLAVAAYGYGWGREPAAAERMPVAHVFFRYGPIDIPADDRRDLPIFAHEGRIHEIERDPRAERAASAALARLGFQRLSQVRPWGVPNEHRHALVLGSEDAWLDALYRDLPELEREGWRVEIDTDFPLQVLRADGPVAAELREGSGIDWFEFDLGVTVDGARLDLVPALLAMMARPDFAAGGAAGGAADNRPLYVPLADGRVVAVPAARLAPILAALGELFAAGVIDPQQKRIGFSPLDAPCVADLEAAAHAAGAAWRGGERIAEIGRLLRETGGIPRASLPESFTGALRPYQARGVDWLQFLRAAGLGGVLADEMGLGKTVQALAYLAIEKAQGRLDRPALIVAPTSIVANWRCEAQRFAPSLTLLTLHGAARKTRFGDIAGHDIVLTTYPLLARDHAVLAANPWHVIILDEAQTIKNPKAITARAVRTLEARHRVCLTGTPLQNHLGELWSLFTFLSPGFLGEWQGFNRLWRTPIEKKGDGARRQLLARRVRPFLLRRNKAEVAAELPPKTEIVETVEMEARQRDLYESIRLAMHAKVREAIAERGLARSRIYVLDALLKLRQVCCDPRLLKLATARKAGSAKLDRLKDMLPSLIEEGRRVLLFSQFTSMLALIEEEIDVPHALLTGQTRDREAQIRLFQEGKVALFLISLKAGGLGLNLTAADTVIHYDPWWNPAVEDQATDRAHRIGQHHPVFVHKLVTLASIEVKMDALKARKRELAASLFDPEAGSTLDLTEADIDLLFGAD